MTESGELTRLQRWIVTALTVAIAVTRLYALSRSLWDWDEALFGVAVRSYDVTLHHPHPPGFPLFVLAAKIVRLLIHNDFRAVQAVTLLGAIALFPALIFLARELRFPFRAAVSGAALYAFFPTVWFFGGTAFSDIPSTTLVLIACTYLLRGARDARALIIGAIVLAISVGFRSQNLLIGCAPALYATWSWLKSSRRQPPAPRPLRPVTLLIAIALGAAIIIISYAGAAYASGDPPRGYFDTLASLRQYVREVDSFLNPARDPLPKLFAAYFVHPLRAGRLDYILDALAVIGLIAGIRRFGTWMAVAMFLPFQLFAWLMLDPWSISRYGTAWLPLYALLAALALHLAAYFWLDVVLAAAIVVRLIVFTWPGIRTVTTGESPTAGAMREILRRHPAQPVFVNVGMTPFANYYLGSTPWTMASDDAGIPWDPRTSSALYVTEGVREGGIVFERQHNVLWNIVRRRYFEVTLIQLANLWRFREGWHDEEGQGRNVYRWMKARSVTTLPSVGARGRLALSFGIPSPLVPAAPTLTVTLNGRVIERVRCTAEAMAKTWDVEANPSGPNELVLSVDRYVNPLRDHLAGDARDLGLRLDGYSWTPLQ